MGAQSMDPHQSASKLSFFVKFLTRLFEFGRAQTALSVSYKLFKKIFPLNKSILIDYHLKSLK